MNFWFEYLFPSVINSILIGLNDSNIKTKFRKAFLKIFKMMAISFAHDPEFVEIAYNMVSITNFPKDTKVSE